MWSVADRACEEDRTALAALSSGERVRLALALGARDLELFRPAQRPPLSRDEAARLLDRRRQAGRRHSRAVEDLIG